GTVHSSTGGGRIPSSDFSDAHRLGASAMPNTDPFPERDSAYLDLRILFHNAFPGCLPRLGHHRITASHGNSIHHTRRHAVARSAEDLIDPHSDGGPIGKRDFNHFPSLPIVPDAIQSLPGSGLFIDFDRIVANIDNPIGR